MIFIIIFFIFYFPALLYSNVDVDINIIFDNGDVMFYKGINDGLKKSEIYKVKVSSGRYEGNKDIIGELKIIEISNFYSKCSFVKPSNVFFVKGSLQFPDGTIIKEGDNLKLIKSEIAVRDEPTKEAEKDFKKEQYEEEYEIEKEEIKIDKKLKEEKLILEELSILRTEEKIPAPIIISSREEIVESLIKRKEVTMNLMTRYETRSGEDNPDNFYTIFSYNSPISQRLMWSSYLILRKPIKTKKEQQAENSEFIIGGNMVFVPNKKCYYTIGVSSSIYDEFQLGEKNKFSLSYSHILSANRKSQTKAGIILSSYPKLTKGESLGIRLSNALKIKSEVDINLSFQFNYSIEENTSLYNLYSISLDKKIGMHYSFNVGYQYIQKTYKLEGMEDEKNDSIVGCGLSASF